MIAAHSHQLKSEAYMRAAQDLLMIGNASSAIGRSFLAMLHATLAQYPEIDDDVDGGGIHGGIEALTERLARLGLPSALGVRLERAFNMRIAAELGTSVARPEDAIQAVAMMTDYVAKLQLLPAAISHGKIGSDA